VNIGKVINSLYSIKPPAEFSKTTIASITASGSDGGKTDSTLGSTTLFPCTLNHP
jgi:hypothetical protein